jgi:hypothetical protein
MFCITPYPYSLGLDLVCDTGSARFNNCCGTDDYQLRKINDSVYTSWGYQRITINGQDSTRINHVHFSTTLAKRKAESGNTVNTVKLVFIASNGERDSIIASIYSYYQANVMNKSIKSTHFIQLKPNRYLVNGQILDNKSKQINQRLIIK